MIAGDETALALLIERVEPRLDGALVAGFSRIPHEWAHDAVQDALLEYAARPDRFNPSFGIALSGFLLIAARRNLLNRLDAAKRRGRHETAVPHTDSSALTPASIPRPERRLDAARLLRRVLEFFDGPERAVLRAILQGETRWEGLARAAHLEDRPPAEQRAIVTRIRKRIAQRLRRFGGRS